MYGCMGTYTEHTIAPNSAGPYAAFLEGELHGGVAQTGMLWALAHSLPRGVRGLLPQKLLEI
jgi:hypothetical protein